METTTQNKELKKVTYIESTDDNGKFKLEIYAYADRKFNRYDNTVFHEAAENIYKKISQESYRLNPKYQKQGAEDKAKMLNLFKDHAIFVQEIPNEYSKNDCHLTWFIVTTKIGHIKIGWRKSVINIDWSATIIVDEANELFPDEDVTKHEKTIHAWSYEKAQEYINKLLNFKKS